MNGEPREAEMTTADLATPANRPASSVHNGDQPMLEAINTDGVTKTAMRDDAKLAPLFTQDAATDFRARWDMVQRSFVDDPRQAVRTGNELVAEVIKSLADSFAGQRSDSDDGLDKTGALTTENLRLALRRYRSFFERLLSI
jgi:hypothetical protein